MSGLLIYNSDATTTLNLRRGTVTSDSIGYFSGSGLGDDYGLTWAESPYTMGVSFNAGNTQLSTSFVITQGGTIIEEGNALTGSRRSTARYDWSTGSATKVYTMRPGGGTFTVTRTYVNSVTNSVTTKSSENIMPPFMEHYGVLGTYTFSYYGFTRGGTSTTVLVPGGTGSQFRTYFYVDGVGYSDFTYKIRESITTVALGDGWTTTTTNISHKITYPEVTESLFTFPKTGFKLTETGSRQRAFWNTYFVGIRTVHAIPHENYIGVFYSNETDLLTNGQTFDFTTSYTTTFKLKSNLPVEAGTATVEESGYDYYYVPVSTVTQAQEIIDENGDTSVETWTEVVYDWSESLTATTYTTITNAGQVDVPFEYTTDDKYYMFAAIVSSGTISAPRSSWDESASGNAHSTFSITTAVSTNTTITGSEPLSGTVIVRSYSSDSEVFTNTFQAYLVATAVNGWVVPNSGFESREASSTVQESFLMSVGLARPGVSLYPPLGSPTPLFYTQTVTHWGNLDMLATDTKGVPSPTTAAFTISSGTTTELSPDVFIATIEGQSNPVVNTVRVGGRGEKQIIPSPHAGNLVGQNIEWTLVVPAPGFLMIYGDSTSSSNFTCPTTALFPNGNEGSFFVFHPRPSGNLLALPKYNYEEV